ncbi:MAG TPA: MYXO-CTERM sorting domain-containing protein [Polyangiaceae bacterium]
MGYGSVVSSTLSKFVFVAALLAPAPALAAHSFDLDSKMPPHLAAVFAVNWFGTPSSDPQGGGADPSYGNWLQKFPQCGLDNDPSTCADFQDAGRQRSIASARRPLAGIYSSSARTDESTKRIDLMLSCVRRPCDLGGRLDAFLLQLDSVAFTSGHPQNQQVKTWDLAYRAVLGFLAEGDKAHMDGSVWIGNDATVYWHFGGAVGLNDQTSRKAALEADIVDMAKLAAAHPSAVSIAGKPFLAFYVDSALMTPTEWQQVLDGARQASGIDFYAMATTLNGTFFSAFDALSPWVNLGLWANAKGANFHDKGVDYATQMHAQLLSALKTNPGRVMFGGVAPGFDDYTQNWGACQPRQIPRDPAVLAGQLGYLTSLKSTQTYDVRGVIWDTWDDWTEGTELEPDVVEGPAKLIQFKQLLGTLYGEQADTTGDQALAQRWLGYGQARSCCFENGPCEAGAPPKVDLSCPTPSGDASADAGSEPDAPGDPDAGSGNETTSGGCGCEAAGAGGGPLAWLSGVAVAILVVTRIRRRATSTSIGD